LGNDSGEFMHDRYLSPGWVERPQLVNIYMTEKRYREAMDQVDAYLTAVPQGPQHSVALELKARIQKETKAAP
jgi:hypothetical protein